MVSEIWQSISEYIRDKAVSPLTGAFLMSWLAWNHRLPIALFSSMPLPQRFGYIDEILYPCWEDVVFKGIVFPLVFATFYLLWYHKPALAIYRVRLRQRQELLDARNAVEKKRLLSLEEADRLRARHQRELDHAQRLAKEVEERNTVLEDAAIVTAKKIEQLEMRLTELQAGGLPAEDPLRNVAIERLLLGRSWRLHFNPQAGKTKQVVFAQEGQLTLGRNDNEHSWRVHEGKLTFVASDGMDYSTFVYDITRNVFMMIDDESPKALKGQFLTP